MGDLGVTEMVCSVGMSPSNRQQGDAKIILKLRVYPIPDFAGHQSCHFLEKIIEHLDGRSARLQGMPKIKMAREFQVAFRSQLREIFAIMFPFANTFAREDISI